MDFLILRSPFEDQSTQELSEPEYEEHMQSMTELCDVVIPGQLEGCTDLARDFIINCTKRDPAIRLDIHPDHNRHM